MTLVARLSRLERLAPASEVDPQIAPFLEDPAVVEGVRHYAFDARPESEKELEPEPETAWARYKRLSPPTVVRLALSRWPSSPSGLLKVTHEFAAIDRALQQMMATLPAVHRAGIGGCLAALHAGDLQGPPYFPNPAYDDHPYREAVGRLLYLAIGHVRNGTPLPADGGQAEVEAGVREVGQAWGRWPETVP